MAGEPRAKFDSIDDLAPYRLSPAPIVSCVKGGFEIEVMVYARHRDTVFFVARDGAQFGVGAVDALGDVVESHHYPNIAMALRAFAGAVKGP